MPTAVEQAQVEDKQNIVIAIAQFRSQAERARNTA
jgi:hypothetical protein